MIPKTWRCRTDGAALADGGLHPELHGVMPAALPSRLVSRDARLPLTQVCPRDAAGRDLVMRSNPTMKISTTSQNPFPHGIDITAPGGIEELIEFHRQTFGDWQMNANSGAGDGGGGGGDGSGDGGDSGGSGGSGDGGDSGGDPGESDPGDGDKGLKSALAAERKTSKQAAADLAAANARIKELEDANKSEEQRQQEAQEQQKSELVSTKEALSQRDNLIEKYEVAAAKGLDLQAAKRLQGSTREEIEKDADDWIALWGTGDGRQEQRRGDPGQGARGRAEESSYAQGREQAKARFGTDKQ